MTIRGLGGWRTLLDSARLTIPATPESGGLARAWVRLTLGSVAGVRPVEYVTSELIAEALAQGAEGTISVDLIPSSGECTVVVISHERQRSRAVEATDLAEYPRLVVVDGLTESLEHRVEPDGLVIMRARITWME
ncbi:hypothetical protein ACFRCG_46620 [Embleya sp. NPDC056575]|uniref:hypothetical protein n=1 Tax=unclassified Embleya TaxID=2699296 RepID=UPI0036A66673